jgi:hypothetical protein
LVDPELTLISVVRDVDIDPTIVVEIRGDDSESVSKLFTDACRHGYIFKDSIAFVVKESIARRAKDTWRAVISRGSCCITVRTVRHRKVSVVHHHQIEPTIAIVVEERRARAPAWIVRTALLRDVGKLSPTFVQIHLIGTEIREIKIGQAVVVDISDGDAHAVAGRDDATLLRYVSECELP